MATQQHTPARDPKHDKSDKERAREREQKATAAAAAPKQEAKPDMQTATASNGAEKVKQQITETEVTPPAAPKAEYTKEEKRALLAKVMEHEPELDKARAELEAAQNKLKALEQARSGNIEALYNAMGAKPFNISGGRSAKCVKRAYKSEDAAGNVTTNVRWYFEIDTPEQLD